MRANADVSPIFPAPERSGSMNTKANILQFRQENGQPANELEDLLETMDDPGNPTPELLFKDLDHLPEREGKGKCLFTPCNPDGSKQ